MQSRNNNAKSLMLKNQLSSSFSNSESSKHENLSKEFSNVNNLFPSYFCLKSSVLSPSSTRLTNQYLALEQLCAHYQMISNAKAQVDTSAPKSMQSSLSYLGQKKKEYWQKSTSNRNNSLDKLKNSISQYEGSSPNLEMQIKRYSNSDLTIDDKVSWYLNSVRKDKIKRNSTTQPQIETDISTPEKAKSFSQNTKHPISIADKLSWYLDAVQQGAFNQEWTLNSNGSSDSDIYDEQNQNNAYAYQFKKQDSNVNKKKGYKKSSETKLRANKAKSKLLDMKCYYPPTQKKKSALKYHPKQHSEDSSEDTDENDNNDGTKLLRFRQYRRRNKRDIFQNSKTYQFKLRQDPHQDSFDFPIQRYRSSLEFVNKNEEMYLNFLSTITEDILKRGIYTDSAIKKAFRFHMKQQKGLNMDVMQQLMDQFLDDLNISKEDSNEQQNLIGRSSPPERENSFQAYLGENQIEGSKESSLQKKLDLPGNSSVDDDNDSSKSNISVKDVIQE